MFIEIEKKKTELPFGVINLWLRYDNAAFLKIERTGYNPFDILSVSESGKAARAFLDAGLDCCINELQIESRRAEIVNALLSGGDTATVMLAIQAALLQALPPPQKNAVNTERSEAGAENIFTFFVDIMHRPESEFWSSTLREIVGRCDRYSILKGWKKAPLHIQRFDNE